MSFKRNFMIQIPKRLPKRCVTFIRKLCRTSGLPSPESARNHIKSSARLPEFEGCPIFGVLRALHEREEKAASAEDA
jgi:hypothetical protein